MVGVVFSGRKCACIGHLGCMKTLLMFPRVLRMNNDVKKQDFYLVSAPSSFYFRL